MFGSGLAFIRSEIAKSKKTEIEQEAAARLAAEEQSLLEQSVSVWPTKLLLKQGWRSKPGMTNLTIWFDAPNDPKPEATSVEVLIKADEETLAHAVVTTFGENYVWPYREDDDFLKDGDENISIRSAIQGTKIGSHVRGAERKPIEVIGVGLESSHGGDPDDIYRHLSDLRGQALIAATRVTLTDTAAQERISYRALGLGRSVDPASFQSLKEKRQRGVLILTIIRHKSEVVELPITAAITQILADETLIGMDLSEYEYFCLIPDRLSPPLNFEGTGEGYWTPPEVTPEECVNLTEGDQGETEK